MMKRLFIIMLIVVSVFLVACTTENNSPDPDEERVDETEDDQDDDQTTKEPDDNIEDDNTSHVGFVYSAENIEEFKLTIELINGIEYDYDFDRSENEAEVEIENDEENNLTGEKAWDRILDLLKNTEISLGSSLNEMMDEILVYLDISREELDEFELELEFLDAKEIDFKYDREEIAENKEVQEFSLEIYFLDDEEWEFEYELNDEYEIRGRESHEGQEARSRIEELIAALDISMDSTIKEVQDNILNHLNLNLEDIKEFDLDIEYLDGGEIDVKVHY